MDVAEKQHCLSFVSLCLSLSVTHTHTHKYASSGELWQGIFRIPSLLAYSFCQLYVTKSNDFRKDTISLFLIEKGSHFSHFIDMAAQR